MAAADQRTLTVSGLGAFDEDWFTRGLMTWTSGANAGRKAEAKLHSKRDGAVTLELWQAMSEEVGGRLYHHRGLRQALRHVHREVRQCRKLPRFPTRAWGRLRSGRA